MFENDPPWLDTERLRLRGWRDRDGVELARLNADARVMEFFERPLTREESDTQLARIRAHWLECGFGCWAIEEKGGAAFVGFVGLTRPKFRTAFTPCVEIGWRLAAEHWGLGYATEAARVVLAHGFRKLGLAEIVSFTTVANLRSRRVMEKIGLHRNPADDFDHPNLAMGHPLRPHVLYRLARDAWPG